MFSSLLLSRRSEGHSHAKRGIGIEEPIYIPLGSKQITEGGDLHHAYTFIFSKLHPTKSRFILYPYSFSKPALNNTLDSDTDTNRTNSTANNATLPVESTSKNRTSTPLIWESGVFPDGSIISVTDEKLPLPNNTNYQLTYFKYVVDETTIDLKRAKALYDMNIAILQMEDFIIEEGNVHSKRFYTWDGMQELNFPVCDDCLQLRSTTRHILRLTLMKKKMKKSLLQDPRKRTCSMKRTHTALLYIPG